MSVPLGREAIWSAFFSLLSPSLLISSGGLFATVGRRAINFEAVATVQQPALYVLQRHEKAEATRRGEPTKWLLKAELFVYALNQADQIAPGSGGGQVLNPLIDAVEKALAPRPVEGNALTLGGLVSRAFIDGEVEVYEGNIINQAVAIIPVTIIAPV